MFDFQANTGTVRKEPIKEAGSAPKLNYGKFTHFRQVRGSWFPWVNDDSSIGQGVGHTLKIGILQGSCQVGALWFPWVYNNGSIWEGV